jgi:hypothetical protein
VTKRKFESRNEQIEFLRKCGPTCSQTQLAQVLGGHPYYFNKQAKDGTLDFDHYWSGRNLKIYTESVIKKLLCI